MQVTDVRLNLINKDGGVKAIGSFALDDSFAIRGVRVMEDKNGRNFVAFPSREKSNGEYEDIAFPLSKEFYHEVTSAILEEYDKVRAQKETKEQDQEVAKEQEQKEVQAQEKTQNQRKGKSR